MSRRKSAADGSRLFKAISHPLRVRILEQLNGREASPSEVARRLGEPLGNVSYHVQVLLEYDAIELVETRPVRGALEHIYRAATRPFIDDAHWAKLPVSLRRSLFDPMLQKIWEHAVEAADADGLDDPQTHISWTALDLDRRGYQEVVELLAKTLDRALEIHSESAGRLGAISEDERESERTELAIMHYHRPRASEQKNRAVKKQRRKRATRSKAKAR